MDTEVPGSVLIAKFSLGYKQSPTISWMICLNVFFGLNVVVDIMPRGYFCLYDSFNNEGKSYVGEWFFPSVVDLCDPMFILWTYTC